MKDKKNNQNKMFNNNQTNNNINNADVQIYDSEDNNKNEKRKDFSSAVISIVFSLFGTIVFFPCCVLSLILSIYGLKYRKQYIKLFMLALVISIFGLLLWAIFVILKSSGIDISNSIKNLS